MEIQTLRETRLKQKATMEDVEVLTKISPTIQNFIETKGQKPNPRTRKRLELVLGEIDWDSSIKWKIRSVKEAEAALEKLLDIIHGLEDKPQFIQTLVRNVELLKKRYPRLHRTKNDCKACKATATVFYM